MSDTPHDSDHLPSSSFGSMARLRAASRAGDLPSQGGSSEANRYYPIVGGIKPPADAKWATPAAPLDPKANSRFILDPDTGVVIEVKLSDDAITASFEAVGTLGGATEDWIEVPIEDEPPTPPEVATAPPPAPPPTAAANGRPEPHEPSPEPPDPASADGTPTAPDATGGTPDHAETPPPPMPTFDQGEVPSVAQIQEWLAVFARDYPAVEIRVINPLHPEKHTGKEKYTHGVRFADLRGAAEYAHRWSGEAMGVYFTINPLNGLEVKGKTAGDEDVSRRLWLFIDADPERGEHKKASATDEEKAIAWDALCKVRDWLRERGWPEPVVCDSGNGWHLFYRIDLPNDDADTLVKRVLESLDQRFSTAAVNVDPVNSNAGRVTKCYGTLACKCDNTTARPHRHARVVSVPDVLEIVPREMLESLAGEPPPPRLDLGAEIERKRAKIAPAESRKASRNGKVEGDTRDPWRGVSTADAYRAKDHWPELMEALTWTHVKTFADGTQRWVRPGATSDSTATIGWRGQDVLHVFSSNAAPFKQHGNYSQFDVYALIYHDGDTKAAAQDLYRKGYGTRQPPPTPRDEDHPGKPIYDDDWPTEPTPPTDAPSANGDGHGTEGEPRRRGKPKTPPKDASDPDLNAELARRARTEMGNSERLVARFGSQAHYVGKWDKWVVWDGARWVIDTKDARVLRLAKDAARLIIAEAATFHDKDKQQAHFKWAMKSQKRSVVSASIYLARPDVMIDHETLNQHPYLFNCPNGTIDLRTGALLEHDPKHLITQLCPTRYDPTAKCPRFLKFLNEIFAGEHCADLVGFMRRWFGYSLTGVCVEQKMPFWFGVGNNGKSTLINAFLKVMGLDYAIEASRDILVARNNPDHLTTIADLFGKRFVAIVETTDEQLDLAQFKHLTGEDRIRARRMREDPWEFSPTHKLNMATNKKPSIPDGGHAEWRRILSVPFKVVIPPEKIDKELGETLTKEAPGILAWGVEGCLEWQKNGLQAPSVVTASTEEYRKSQDSLEPFLRAECVRRFPRTADLKIKTSALREAYVKWCERQDHETLKPRQFDEAMETKGFEIKRNNGSWFYGIGLRRDNRQLAAEDDKQE